MATFFIFFLSLIRNNIGFYYTCNSKAYKASKKEEARNQLNEQTAGKQFNMVGINYATAQKLKK